MALLDLLGRRMALRIIWELSSAELTFRALLEAAETNPSVLNARLRELREAGIVEHQTGKGYALSPRGRRLVKSLAPLLAWSASWKERP
jgi:DNA-binding HxlR family transcriptional regulator